MLTSLKTLVLILTSVLVTALVNCSERQLQGASRLLYPTMMAELPARPIRGLSNDCIVWRDHSGRTDWLQRIVGSDGAV